MPEPKTKAPVPAPKRASFLGGLTELSTTPPTSAPQNLAADVDLANLNFKVEPEFKRHFRLTAVSNSITSRQLLEQCFAAWLREKTK